MNSLDPSYLRYIYDGIFNGVIASDNESTLPEGLVGLYEDAFLENIPVYRRQKSLEIFACWALLKKEASILFVSEILQVDETEIFEIVGTYSSWFNSPESGKHSLYHERLRIYFLQKLNENEIQSINQRLIARLQKAIAEQYKDEFEIYALQFLSDHLLVEAFADETKGKELLGFTKDEKIWNRQIKVSNQFLWTKNSIQNSILWTSQHDPKESVFGYLDLVELHHKEQNDAENIVALVANNEIDLALKRMESFGGTDQEGLKRKFILYMLCLMELTLLESKTQSWRKEAIEKILKHFDEQMPIEPSILNWNDFFSSYLVFQIACELMEFGIDYLIIYKRTDDWDSVWIEDMGPYSESQFNVLHKLTVILSNQEHINCIVKYISIELARQSKIEEAFKFISYISNQSEMNRSLLDISTQLATNRDIEKALKTTIDISDNYYKSRALTSICTEFAKQHRIVEGLNYVKNISLDFYKIVALMNISSECEQIEKTSLITDTIEFANNIRDETIKNRSKAYISKKLAEEGNINEAIEYARGISNESNKSRALESISGELAKQGKIEEALECARGISFKFNKVTTLLNLSTQLNKQGKVDYSKSMILEAHEIAKSISVEYEKDMTFIDISNELAKQGKFDEALVYTEINHLYYNKSIALKYISIEFVKQEKLSESLKYALNINDEEEKNNAYLNIFTVLAKKGKFDEVIQSMSLPLKSIKTAIIKVVSNEFTLQKKLIETKCVLIKFIEYFRGNIYESGKNNTLNCISIKFAKQNEFDKAIACSFAIKNISNVNSTLQSISIEFVKQGKLSKAILCLNDINDLLDKNLTLINICIELSKQGEIEEAYTHAHKISDDLNKSKALYKISDELTKQFNYKEAKIVMTKAIECARNISNEFDKIEALLYISSELAIMGRVNEAHTIMNEVIEYAYLIKDSSKFFVFKDISTELAKQGKLDEALIIITNVSSKMLKNETLKKITKILAKQGHIDKAIECINNISFEKQKSEAQKYISLELVKQGKTYEAIAYKLNINLDFFKRLTYDSISIELSRQGDWITAEKIGFEIPQIATFQSCWKEITKTQIEEKGAVVALETLSYLQNEEVRKYYLKGWAENVTINDLTEELLLKALPLLKDDPESIEHLLQTHAINELFFGEAKNEVIQQYNRTLNIQWAMDIKSQLN